jgi:hypothetical protein
MTDTHAQTPGFSPEEHVDMRTSNKQLRLLDDPSAIEDLKEIYCNSPLDPVTFYNAIKAEFPEKQDRRAIKQILKECVREQATCELFTLDIRNYVKRIKPESIDWIITDPPYPADYLELYDTLSELGEYALRPSGGMLVMTGQSYLVDVLHSLSQHMNYAWTLAYLTPGGQSAHIWPLGCNTFWKPVFLLTKGSYKGMGFGDVIQTSPNNNDKSHHHWGQSVEGFDELVRRFTFPGQVVLDPFLGGGATAVAALRNHCSFIGFDVDPKCVETTRKRIANEL